MRHFYLATKRVARIESAMRIISATDKPNSSAYLHISSMWDFFDKRLLDQFRILDNWLAKLQ